MEQMLKQLPPEQREAIFLVDVAGFSLQETAELVNAPLGTIKSRRNRAKAHLIITAAQEVAEDVSDEIEGRADGIDTATVTLAKSA